MWLSLITLMKNVLIKHILLGTSKSICKSLFSQYSSCMASPGLKTEDYPLFFESLIFWIRFLNWLKKDKSLSGREKKLCPVYVLILCKTISHIIVFNFTKIINCVLLIAILPMRKLNYKEIVKYPTLIIANKWLEWNLNMSKSNYKIEASIKP